MRKVLDNGKCDAKSGEQQCHGNTGFLWKMTVFVHLGLHEKNGAQDDLYNTSTY